MSDWEPLRTVILFFAGLVGVAYETIFAHPPDPTLLIVFGAMMGIPLFLRNGKNGGK
jgi:hypothetical protein